MTTAFWNEGFTVDEATADPGRDLKTRVLAYERRLIESALRQTGGNQRRAAKLLGILPTTLNEKLKRFRRVEAPGPSGS